MKKFEHVLHRLGLVLTAEQPPELEQNPLYQHLRDEIDAELGRALPTVAKLADSLEQAAAAVQRKQPTVVAEEEHAAEHPPAHGKEHAPAHGHGRAHGH